MADSPETASRRTGPECHEKARSLGEACPEIPGCGARPGRFPAGSREFPGQPGNRRDSKAGGGAGAGGAGTGVAQAGTPAERRAASAWNGAASGLSVAAIGVPESPDSRISRFSGSAPRNGSPSRAASTSTPPWPKT